MTIKEAKRALQQLKDEGETDKQILGGMYLMYQHDELTLDDLRVMVELLGYEFTDEFEALSEEEKKNLKNAFQDVEEIDEEEDEEDEEEEEKELPPWFNQYDENGNRILPPWIHPMSEDDYNSEKPSVLDKIKKEMATFDRIQDMPFEEVKAFFDELKDFGDSDAYIMDSLYKLYTDGKLTLKKFRDLIGVLLSCDSANEE